MSRQRVASSRIRSHEMLVHRTSAHVRAATNGVIGALLLAAVAAFAALTIWPSQAETVGLESAVTRVREEGWDRYAPIVLTVSAALGAASFVFAMAKVRRWRLERHINRVSAELATTDPSMIDPTTDHRVLAAGLPPPRIAWVAGPRHGMPKLQTLTPTTNVIGLPRLEITYLRLFNNQYRHVSFVKGAWREFGTVSMLRSAVSMTTKEAQRARASGIESLFVTTRPQLESQLAAVGTAPDYGSSRVDAGPTRVRVRDRYGAYPMRSVLCANATWRAAVDRLIEGADLVVLDLSGYTDRRAGTRYELQRVLDRVPAERLIFLADPMSKNKILEEAISDAWAHMSASSPNAAHPEIPLWIARVDRIVKKVDQERHTATVELVTSRKETRLLMTVVQDRLHGARPISAESGAVDPEVATDIDPWAAYGAPSMGRSAVPAATPASDDFDDDVAFDTSGGSPTPAPRPHRWRVVGIAIALVIVGAGAAAFVMQTDEPERSDTTTSSDECPALGEDELHRDDARRDPCESVAEAQRRLNALGYPLTVDGLFGPRTEAAVIRFQEDNGLLPADGRIGPDTWARMNDPANVTS